MDDEVYEEIISEEPEGAPVLEDIPTPEEPSEAVEADPAADPVPDPEPAPAVPSDPVEVVTVEDLLDRLTGEAQEDETREDAGTEGPSQEESAADYVPENNLPAAIVDGGPIEIVGMDKALKHLETIQGAVEHPMMETPFEEYTVTEGLLLLFFVILVLDFFLNLLRRWF